MQPKPVMAGWRGVVNKEDNVNSQEKQFVIAALRSGQSVQDAAEALVMRRAVEEVEKVAQELRRRANVQGRARERFYYTLLGPKPEPTLVRVSDEGVEMWEQPARQEYRVRCVDFPRSARRKDCHSGRCRSWSRANGQM